MIFAFWILVGLMMYHVFTNTGNIWYTLTVPIFALVVRFLSSFRQPANNDEEAEES